MAINQDVQNRVDAYRGNPEALTQRYQQNQQLIDLLALQKIKSEKEAAVRQMQMSMAQQQAASGEAPMTVAQQREKEVMGLTKDELAGQQGELLQQKQGEQQAAMQKLMGGIASAPGAQSAATPQAMAAGGIVAFNGETGSSVARQPRRGYIIDPETGEERRMTAAELLMDTQRRGATAPEAPTPETESTAGMMLRSVGEIFSPKGSDAQKYRQDALRNQGIRKAISAVTPGMLEQLTPEERGIRQQHQEYLRGQLNQNPAAPAATTPAPAPAGAYRDENREDRRVGPISPPPPPPPPATRRPAGPAAPTMPAAPAASAGPTPEQNEMQTALSQGILGALRTNPAAEQGAEYMRASNILGMSPEEKTARAQNRARLEAMDAAQFDPAKQQAAKLQNFLLGMGGQSSGFGALGAGGVSATNYERSMYDLARRRMMERQGLEEGDFEKERGIRGEAYKGGLEALKQASQRQNQGVSSGASLVATLRRSADDAKKLVFEGDQNALNRAVEREKIRAQNATTEAKRTGDQQQAVSALLMTASARVMETTGKISMKYAPLIRDAAAMPGKDTATKVRDLETRRDAEIQAATTEMARDTDDLRTRLLQMSSGSGGATRAPSAGGTNTGGITVRSSRPAGGQ